MTERVTCLRCGHRTHRAWHIRACYENWACSSFGEHANCGGMYVRPEGLRQWKKWTKHLKENTTPCGSTQTTLSLSPFATTTTAA